MSRNRYVAVILWLAFVAVCAIVVVRSTFNTDMSAFLPSAPTPGQQVMVEQLRDGVVSRLILVGMEGAPPEALARISKDMAAQLRGDAELLAVNNGERIGLEKDFELLWRNRYLLSDAVDAERFGVQGLKARLTDYLELLGAPMSSMVQQVMPRDPSGELMYLLDRLQGQGHPRMQDDVWFSRDSTRAMMLIQTKGGGSDIDAQERAMRHVQAAFDAAAKNQAGARMRMTGPGVFSVQSRAAIREDAWRLSLIATALVACMLLLVYRSPRVLVLGLLPVASGALAGVAAVSLGFDSVHGITLGFGVTLIGEGVDYAIYLFTQMDRQDGPQATLQRIWPTLRLGVLTSICGFSAMLFSGFTGLAQLGLFSIAGLIVAVGTTRWVLPQLLPEGFSVWASSRLSGLLMRMVRRAPRARPVLALLLLATLSLLVAKRGEWWNDSLASMSPVPLEAQQLDQQMRDDIGAPDVRYQLVLQADSQEQVLQLGEEAAILLRERMRAGDLEGMDTPPLPSLRMQRERLAALPEPEVLGDNLKQALRGLPYRENTFALSLNEIAEAKRQPLLERDAFSGSGLGLKLDAFLQQGGSGWSLSLPLRGVRQAESIERELGSRLGAPFILLDMKRETDRMFQDYRREATRNSLLGAMAIVVLLFAVLRSPRRVLEVLLPLLAAVVVVTAGLLFFGHALSIFHLIGLLLVVAVGSNYALFFAHRFATDMERERMILSLLLANASTVLGFGLLSFSQSQVLSAIGSTVAAGAVLSLAFSAILISENKA